MQFNTNAERGLTARALRHHNRDSVSHRFCRVSVTLVLAPWLALSATLAPEHVHETDADHPHGIAHRHFAAHHVAPLDQYSAEIDHADGHIVWLDDVGAFQAPYQLPVPDVTPPDRFELAPALEGWIATPVNDTAPPHGPPRFAHPLRGPPRSARLI
jgi:hypothetical protein